MLLSREREIKIYTGKKKTKHTVYYVCIFAVHLFCYSARQTGREGRGSVVPVFVV